MAKVILKFGPAIISEIQMMKDVLSVGRKSDNDIVIDNLAVSGHHAKIYKHENSYIVEDLGSTNGTFLNDIKIIKADLHDKDRIGFAKHTLVFISEDVSAAVAPLDKDIKSSDETVIIDSAQRREIIDSIVKPTQVLAERVGTLRIIDGVVNDTEVELSSLLAYIGTDVNTFVKIKGFLAPKIAAAIARKSDGYILKAVKEGYPKVNGKSLQDQVKLNDGDVLEFGKTKMVFFEKEVKSDKVKE